MNNNHGSSHRYHELYDKIFGVDHHDQLTFRQLKQAERLRRELLQRGKMFSRQHLYLQIWGTVLPVVLKSVEFWFSMFVFAVTRIIIGTGVASNLELNIDSRSIASVGGFISFMLVFYNNQVYGRFSVQYENSMKMEGKIFNLAYLARDNMHTNMAWQFVRYLNCAHVLGYVGLSDTYERQNLFEPFNKQLKLFTVDEVMRLNEMDMDKMGARCYLEVLGWATRLLSDDHHAGMLVPVVYNNMMSEVLQLRASISALFEFEDQPIPFVYVHLIYFLTAFYLPLFSFFVAISYGNLNHLANIPGVVIVFLNNFFIVGLLEIGKFMSEPYGADHCDLSVMHYIHFTWQQTRRIMSGKRFEPNTIEVEQLLEQGRPALGNGFVGGTMTCDILSAKDYQRQMMQASQNVLHSLASMTDETAVVSNQV
jgi:predicted membrane chloride channel (bestrophin family)